MSYPLFALDERDSFCNLEVNNKIFTDEEIAELNPLLIPKHIAIIPDGNRRWASYHNTSTAAGHENGADIIIDIVRASKELGVKAITFYTFSTENWLRSEEEVEMLMGIIESYLLNQKDRMIAEGIRFNTIGCNRKLPFSLLKTIEETKSATSNCHDIDLILAINYGGRDDITRALKEIVKDHNRGFLDLDKITEETISKYLDTSPWPDPELLIRTSGEFRISNFLNWQIAYSEILTIDKFWPDFTPHNLYHAIKHFQHRQRRLGH